MEELLTKYGVNLNNYSGTYDTVAFMCKDCCMKPYMWYDKNHMLMPGTRIKPIVISDGDCEHKHIEAVSLNPEGIEKKFTVTIEETVAQDFEIVAADAATAFEMAKERYKNGEIAISPGEVHSTRMAVGWEGNNFPNWIEI